MADLLDKFRGLAQVDGTADTVFKIAEREIRTETNIAVFAPGGDDRALAGNKCRFGKDLRFYFFKHGRIFLGSESRFFHVRRVGQTFFSTKNTKNLRLREGGFGSGRLDRGQVGGDDDGIIYI